MLTALFTGVFSASFLSPCSFVPFVPFSPPPPFSPTPPHLHQVRSLVAAGAVTSVWDAAGRTPIHNILTSPGTPAPVRAVVLAELIAVGGDVNGRSEQGDTPAMTAVQVAAYECLQVLQGAPLCDLHHVQVRVPWTFYKVFP